MSFPPTLFPPATVQLKIHGSKYGYQPDLAFAIIGIVTFSLSSLLHAYQVGREIDDGMQSSHSIIWTATTLSKHVDWY